MAIKPIRVSQLNGYIKKILQMDPLLKDVRVVGEISNLKFHGTGHVYFTMKDDSSKISCFLPEDRAKALRYTLEEGMEIIATGYLYLYEKGGTYSLNIRDIEVEGVGNLSVALEALKEKLRKEGLFEAGRKKPIPFFPRKVAVLTSETGAAVQDILKIIQGRNPIVDILIYPVPVQGVGAAEEIAKGIREVNRLFPETDVMIVGRGGGSIEELWAFNEEVLARSIAASSIPIISAVGHETDVTVADFVADLRAETPTAAAALAVPDIYKLRDRVRTLLEQMLRDLTSHLVAKEKALERYSRERMRLDLNGRVELEQVKLSNLGLQLEQGIKQLYETLEQKLKSAKEELEALSPFNIMERGYGVILNEEGQMMSRAENFQKGDFLKVVFSDGSLDCKVEEKMRGRKSG